jgi:hypothetical protein
MPAIKITSFLGTTPKSASELLPATAAQIAQNCKLYSGDLIPFNTPHIVASTSRTGTVRTLYALRNSDEDSLVWLSWLTDVDIVTPAQDSLNEQRFYYTGDGKPKVSNYRLATSGTAPYPSANGFYELGLPLPTTKPTTTATAFTAITTANYSRDNANNVTVTTSSAHNIKDGASISVSGVSTTTFNVVTTATVISSTSFSYYAVGPAGTASGGTIDLGGSIQARTYLYTWYTPWNEESIGSETSTALFIKEGQIVTVASLPTAPPSGDNFVRGIRLYRTLSGTTQAEYYRLQTLWFPNTITNVSRSSNVSRVTFQYPHNLIADDRFKISGCSSATFDITGGTVSEVIDEYTFTYAQTAVDIVSTTASGTLYYDVSETATSTARYWGDGGNYDFTDDFNYKSLTSTLATNDYLAPPDDLQGLTVVQSTFLAGFVGNDLYFSEPNAFHAWPDSYKRSFESNIVGLASVGSQLLVLTESFPYIVDGSDPAVMTQSKLPSRYPCLNRKSIVETSFGVVYATHDGLAVWAPSAGAQLLTRLIHSSDTWNESLNPDTLIGVTYKDTYFASHSAGSIVLEPGAKQEAPSFVNSSFTFSAAWYDSLTNILYVTSGTDGDIYHWDDLTQPSLQMTWKSKTLVTKDFVNLGAARVIADYATNETPYEWATAAVDWESADQIWNSDDPITFRLYVNKELKFSRICTGTDVFRLPSGYKSDTFEFELESYIRVRSVHLGDTPVSLRDA